MCKIYILIKIITSICFFSLCFLDTNVLQTLLTSFKDLVFGILKKLCISNGGERGWSPIAWEKEGVPISREEDKDYENEIRKMKEWNNI